MIRNHADHSANERTFLAWVRTVIAVIGFGLAAARLDGTVPARGSEIALLLVGALVVLLAYLRMRSLRRRIDAATELDDEALPVDALLLGLIAALFALLGAFGLHVI